MNDIQKRRSLSSAMIIGFIAGGTEAVITNPLVTIKSCLQRGISLPWSTWFPKNLGIYSAGIGTLNMVRFLYRGTNARVIGIGLSVGVRVFVHDLLTKHVFKTNDLTLKQEAVTALSAGFFSAFLNTPMELGMTLQQTADPSKKSDNLLKIFKNIQSEWGAKKALTGFSCIYGRDVIVTSGFLTLAPKFSKYISNEYNINNHSSTLIGGTIIGTGLSIITHPLDTIKTFQQSNLRNTNYKEGLSIRASAKQIFEKNGISGFYKGLFFRAARIGPHVGIVTVMSDVLTNVSNTYVKNYKI